MNKEILLSKLKTDLKSYKSYENYVVRIKVLEDLIGKTIDYILKNPEECYPIIKEKYPNINTRKNMMTPILTLFRLNSDVFSEIDKNKWKQYHDDMNTILGVRARQNKIPEKAEENYVSTEEVELKVKELQRSGDPHETLNKSQQYLLLNLLIDLKPKRSDFGALKIYKNIDPLQKEENYLVIRDNNNESSFIVLQVYKTSKYYGRSEEDLSLQSINVIKQSLRRYPREYLFIDRFHRPFQSNNSYGRFVERTFIENFGRKLGTSLWRNVYRTEKITDDMKDEEKREISRLMLHSRKQSDQYRWVKKDNGKKVCYCQDK